MSLCKNDRKYVLNISSASEVTISTLWTKNDIIFQIMFKISDSN